jgi:hypothetical protein
MTQPELQDWEKLYRAAQEFKQKQPWEWMSNDQIFAVEDPESGEVAYITIMGNGGMEFGIGMFLGMEGFRRFYELMTDENPLNGIDKQIMTPVLTFMLGSRQDMSKDDLAVIKALGLKFRGAHDWPFFRSQKPGYLPWVFDRRECHFVTAVIERALVISQKAPDQPPTLLERAGEYKVLTCFLRDGQWIEEWRKVEFDPADLAPRTTPLTPVEEAELLLLRNTRKLSGSWEVDYFIMPTPVEDAGKQPYFPLCFFGVDKKAAQVIGFEFTQPWISDVEKRAILIKTLQGHGLTPRTILVKSKEIFTLLEPLTGYLGASLKVGSLSILNETISKIFQKFDR